MSNDIGQVAKHFDVRAGRYANAASWVNDIESLKPLGALVDRVRPARLLELGSGTGAVPAFLAQTGRSVHSYVGVDVARSMLDRQPGWVRAIQADAAHLPVRDLCVDLVVGRQVWHYLADSTSVFREARRVLRPGGQLVVLQIVPFDDAVDQSWWRDAVQLRQPLRATFPTSETLEQDAASVGLPRADRQLIERRSSLRNWLDRYELPSGARRELVRHFRDAPRSVQEQREFVGGGEHTEYTIRWLVATFTAPWRGV